MEIPRPLIIAGLVTGCNRLPDSYTATVLVNTPGETDFQGTEVEIAFKQGALRVDLEQGTALDGFALAWRTRPQVYVVMPGREVSFRWDTRYVAERYGIPRLEEVLVLPFTSSPWMAEARLMTDSEKVDGQPCGLWAKLTDRFLYRIWVHSKWGIPLRFETARPEGPLVASYELRKVKPFARLREELFEAPDATESTRTSR